MRIINQLTWAFQHVHPAHGRTAPKTCRRHLLVHQCIYNSICPLQWHHLCPLEWPKHLLNLNKLLKKLSQESPPTVHLHWTRVYKFYFEKKCLLYRNYSYSYIYFSYNYVTKSNVIICMLITNYFHTWFLMVCSGCNLYRVFKLIPKTNKNSLLTAPMAYPLRLSHNEIYTAQRLWFSHSKNVTLPVVYYGFFFLLWLLKKLTDMTSCSLCEKNMSETLDYIFIYGCV